MAWNWELPHWPTFINDASAISFLEKTFLRGVGGIFAILKYLEKDESKRFVVEFPCAEGNPGL